MKTEYSRYKELVRKIIPGKMAGSKRGQSALSVFLIVLQKTVDKRRSGVYN